MSEWEQLELGPFVRNGDLPGAKLFARGWFYKVAEYCELVEEESALDQHFFAIAGAMPFLLEEKGCDESAYSALHEDLERFVAVRFRPTVRSRARAGRQTGSVAHCLKALKLT